MNGSQQQNPAHSDTAQQTSCHFSHHARVRMTGRRLSEHDVTAVIEFGRHIHARGAQIYVVGRKEIVNFRKRGMDLRPLEGIHVVCSREGYVITTYRSRDLRGVQHLR